MRVTRANFGGYIGVRYVADGVTKWMDSYNAILDQGVLHPTANTTHTDVPVETGPFEVADFGERNRLSWASGACSIGPVGRFAFWAQRFAAWQTHATLTVIDAARPVVLTLKVAGLFEADTTYRDFRSHVGFLWFESNGGLACIALADLEALFDRAPGAMQVQIQETYPHHKPGVTRGAEVVALGRKNVTLKLDDENSSWVQPLAIPVFEGAASGMKVQLHEEITRNVFRMLELPDGRKIELNEKPVSSRNLTADLAIDPAVDPAGGPIVIGDAPSRQADLDRLFEVLADDPEDTATREILIDLLEDSGEPYAELLHELVAGESDDAKRKAALGPLMNYLVALEYAGGLPHTATLSTKAPPDPIIVDAIVTDQRWGLFRTLRIGDGSFAVYAKLVSSPRALGLRHVDVPNARILTALIAGKRTQLTAVSNVKFATRAVIEGLADATFDRVVDLHTETTAETLPMQLEYFIRDETGFWKRAPRHLILTERFGQEHELAKWVTAAWPRLPVAAVTCGALVLRR